MTGAEEALKAVVILTEIVTEFIQNPALEARRLIELADLRLGCEALLQGRRGSNYAQAIISREVPKPPYANG